MKNIRFESTNGGGQTTFKTPSERAIIVAQRQESETKGGDYGT